MDVNDTDWTWGNDTPVWLKPRRTVYFVFRRIHGNVEFLRGKRGRVRIWRSREAVKDALCQLDRPDPPRGVTMLGNQYLLLPPQPDPKDCRPRNAFGFLIGFGKAARAFYEKRDKQIAKAKARKKRKAT